MFIHGENVSVSKQNVNGLHSVSFSFLVYIVVMGSFLEIADHAMRSTGPVAFRQEIHFID
jgi:hypothetical protein